MSKAARKCRVTKVCKMGGQGKASISQATQKPQTISPGMTKEAAPLIGQDLNRDAHTKELAWVTLFIATMNHTVCLRASGSFVQREPPPKVTPLGNIWKAHQQLSQPCIWLCASWLHLIPLLVHPQQGVSDRRGVTDPALEKCPGGAQTGRMRTRRTSSGARRVERGPKNDIKEIGKTLFPPGHCQWFRHPSGALPASLLLHF